MIILFTLCAGFGHATAEVNVYSARQEHLIAPLLDRFTGQTGVKTRLLTAKADALLERLKLEGESSPADLLITVDAARLYRAKKLGLLQSIKSERLAETVPAVYRDKDDQWFGLSLRARVIVAARERIKDGAINDYESLARPQWRKRICIRSSNNVYNQSLVASIIHARGEEETLRWIKGLVANLARPPAGGDRDQILLAASGQCDIAVVNTYYFGIMLQSNDPGHRQAAAQMEIVWPNQAGRGTHVNISGGGVLRSAKNKREAQQLLEYLVGKQAQAWYSRENYEYPVRSDVAPPDTLRAWGRFKADSVELDKIGELNAQAVKLMDRGGWL